MYPFVALRRWLHPFIIGVVLAAQMIPGISLAAEFPPPAPVENLIGGWARSDVGSGFVVLIGWDISGDYQAQNKPDIKASDASYKIERTPAWSDGTRQVVVGPGGGPTGNFGTDASGPMNLGGHYLDYDVLKGETYTYTVRAVSAWEPTESAPQMVTVPIKPKEDYCGQFRLFAGELGGGKGKLLWTESCDANQYRVQTAFYPRVNGKTGAEIDSEQTLEGAARDSKFDVNPGTYTVTLTSQYKTASGAVKDLEKLTKSFQINEKPVAADFGCTPPANPILGTGAGAPVGTGNGWPNGWHVPDFSAAKMKLAAAHEVGWMEGSTGRNALGNSASKLDYSNGVINGTGLKFLYYPGAELGFPYYDANTGDITISPYGVIEYGTPVTVVTPEKTETLYPKNIGSWDKSIGGGYWILGSQGFRSGFKPVFVKASGDVILKPAVDEHNQIMVGENIKDRVVTIYGSWPSNAGVGAITKSDDGNRSFSNGTIQSAEDKRDAAGNIVANALPHDPNFASPRQKVIRVTPDLIGPLSIRGTWRNGMCGTLVAPDAIELTQEDIQTQVSYVFPPHFRGLNQGVVARIQILARRVHADGTIEPLARRALVANPKDSIVGLGLSIEAAQQEAETGSGVGELHVTTDESGIATVYAVFTGRFGGKLDIYDETLDATKYPLELDSPAASSGNAGLSATSSRLTASQPSSTVSATTPLSAVIGGGTPTLTLAVTANFPMSSLPSLHRLTLGDADAGTLTANAGGSFDVPLDAFGRASVKLTAPSGDLAYTGEAERHYTVNATFTYPDGETQTSSQIIYVTAPAPIQLKITPTWPTGVDPANPQLPAGTEVPVAIQAFRTITDAAGTKSDVPVSGLAISLRIQGYRDALDPDPGHDLPWVPGGKITDAAGRVWQLNYVNDLAFPTVTTIAAVAGLIKGPAVTTDAAGRVELTMKVPLDLIAQVTKTANGTTTTITGDPFTISLRTSDPVAPTPNYLLRASLNFVGLPTNLGTFRVAVAAGDAAKAANPQTAASLGAQATVLNTDGSASGPLAGANLDLKASLPKQFWKLRDWSNDPLAQILAGSLDVPAGMVGETSSSQVVGLTGATNADGGRDLPFLLSPGLRFPGASLNLSFGANKAGYTSQTLLDKPTMPTATLHLQAPVALHLRADRAASDPATSVTIHSELATTYGDPIDWYFAERLKAAGQDPKTFLPQYTWLTAEGAQTVGENGGTPSLPTAPAMTDATARTAHFSRGAGVGNDINQLRATLTLPPGMGYPVATSPATTLSIDWSKLGTTAAAAPSGTETDLTASATVTCSSRYNRLPGCFAKPDRTEWTSDYGGQDAWIQLSWDTPQTITSLSLVDGSDITTSMVNTDLGALRLALENNRAANPNDPAFKYKEYVDSSCATISTYNRCDVRYRDGHAGIKQAALTFSDGSTLLTGQLPDYYQELTLSFAPKTITWVRLTVDATTDWFGSRGGRPSVGLKKFAARGIAGPVPTEASGTPAPTPTETSSPTPTSSGTATPTASPTATASPSPTGSSSSPTPSGT